MLLPPQWIGKNVVGISGGCADGSFRLDMLRPLTASRDVRLSGHVIFTGRSSMEIGLRMESIGGGNPDETILIGEFCFYFPFKTPCLMSHRSVLDGVPR